MKSLCLVCSLWAALASAWTCEAQIYDTNNEVVQTFAGSGFYGYLNGVGQQTMFNDPSAVVADSSNNFFVLDYDNSVVRKITPDGTVSTFAGGGSSPIPGSGTNVSLPNGGLLASGQLALTMAVDHNNALWLIEFPYNEVNGFLIRIGPDGYVSATTNLPGLVWFSGGSPPPAGVCVDSGNNDTIVTRPGPWLVCPRGPG